MPAQEAQQPQPIQMVAPQPMDAARVSSEQPVRPSTSFSPALPPNRILTDLYSVQLNR